MSLRTHLLVLASTTVFLSTADAAVVFYVNNLAGFNAAVAASTLLGTEDWEQSSISANTIQAIPDPLAPGVASAHFPTGTNPASGITAQSNILGVNPVNVNPLGASGLSINGQGFFGAPSKQLTPNSFGHSFDMIVNPAGGPAGAVGLQPLYINAAASTASSHKGDVRVSVYDPSNVLLGTQVVPDADYSQTSFVGIVTTEGSVIGRINVAAVSNAGTSTSGADGIRVFSTIPEPSTSVVGALALAGLGLRRRRSC